MTAGTAPETGQTAPEASWFLPEAREGFYVSDMMKRYWAAQLKVLSVIDEICTRHGIPYFADNGSLLGAVRHAGYIPWDDDFDIAMLRHDLRRFLKAAEQELPEGWVILDLAHEEAYGMYLTRIVNARAIDFSEQHLKIFYGCPFTVGVDIFPLDGLYADEEKEEQRRLLAFDAMQAAKLASEGRTASAEYRERVARLSRDCGLNLNGSGNPVRQLLLLTDRLFSECDSKTASHVALMPFWAEYKNHRYDKEWYREAVRMPFEYTTLPVPAYYEDVLRTEYGDFMRIVKAGGVHDYPVYHEQEEIFKEKTGKYPWRYTFEKADTEEIPRPASREEKIRQMTNTLREAQEKTEALLNAGQQEAAAQLAASCRNLADALEQLIGRKKKMLFLAVKADWWKSMEPYYRRACADEGNEVTLMVLPYIEARPDGADPVPRDDSALFPQEPVIVKPSAYDFAREAPDEIFLQSPYDAECNAVMLPEFFHAKNLKGFTAKLVCLPCHDLYTPEEADGKAKAALKVLIEQPGILQADEILVPTEGMREIYIGVLTGLTGEGSRMRWESRVFTGNTFPQAAV
ncbi:MAG: LicD family protein [Lachnospiraceae bacterium]|nr:LicD family protein [Lachnospiraceae bacterium]